MTGGAINELAAVIGTSAACRAVGRSRASYYRHRRPRPDPAVVRARRRAAQPRALTELERAEVLEVLHSDPFVDESPATIYATLLDGGRYLASTSTMYRLLRQAHGGVVERRRHASHPPRSRPELIAEAPNDVWSWDITRLRGPARRQFFYLYVLLDLYSRYVPGWMLASVERAELARRLIDETVAKHDVDPTGLTIHSDRGVPAAKPVAQLLADLEITRSLTRPHTPNDNPVLREPVPDHEVPAGLPRAVRRHRRRPRLLHRLLRLAQLRPPPLRHRVPHPRLGLLGHRNRDTRPAGSRARRRLPDPPRTLRSRAASSTAAARRRLHQPTPTGGRHSLISQRSCLTGLDRRRNRSTYLPFASGSERRSAVSVPARDRSI